MYIYMKHTHLHWGVEQNKPKHNTLPFFNTFVNVGNLNVITKHLSKFQHVTVVVFLKKNI